MKIIKLQKTTSCSYFQSSNLNSNIDLETDLLGELFSRGLSHYNLDDLPELLKDGGIAHSNIMSAEHIGDQIIMSFDDLDASGNLLEATIPFDKLLPLLQVWPTVYKVFPEIVTIKYDDEYNFQMYFDDKKVL